MLAKMVPPVIFCLLFVSISGHTDLRNYNESYAQAVFENNSAIVYERPPTGSIMNFNEEEKEVKVLIFYTRLWKDTTLPKFTPKKGKTFYKVVHKVWEPALPYLKEQYSVTSDRFYARGDNWIINFKLLTMNLPCHRLSNYRYPKDRFQCYGLHNTWETPRHRVTCLASYWRQFFGNFTYKPTVNTKCLRNKLDRSLKFLLSYFKTDWRVVMIRPFTSDNQRRVRALEVDIERNRSHFYIAEVLTAVGIGVVVLCQSLLPPVMGQRILLGGFGFLVTMVYLQSLQGLNIVRDGYEFHLIWLGLGLVILQAWVLLLSILCWNLSQRMDQVPLWLNPLRSIPLFGANSLTEEPYDQWRDVILVIGRLSFVFNSLVFIILMCSSLV